LLAGKANININIFKGLEVLENVNNNTEPIKPSPIFMSKVSDPSSFRQLLNETNGEFDLKNSNPDNYKIQSKSSIAYINIVKELKIRNTEFQIYKPNPERSVKVVLKHMPPREKVDAMKKDTEELGHTVTNILNIKKRGIKISLYVVHIPRQIKASK